MYRTLPTLILLATLAFAVPAPSLPVLAYSTYLRENFTPKAIAADSAGNVYLAGDTIVNPANSQTAVLVLQVNPRTNQYLYTRFLRGSVNDHAYAIDSAGNAYIAGATASPDFPVTSGGNLQNSLAGNAGQRSFVTKLDSNGNIVFSNIFGGPAASMAQAIALKGRAQLGAPISVFVNALAPDPNITSAPIQLFANNGWTVTGIF